MKKLILSSNSVIHTFEADRCLFDNTLMVVKDECIIAEFSIWDYWKYE